MDGAQIAIQPNPLHCACICHCVTLVLMRRCYTVCTQFQQCVRLCTVLLRPLSTCCSWRVLSHLPAPMTALRQRRLPRQTRR